ncbi:MAG: hypothetical protein WBS54_11055 [Acidobacteriota bacterium]
MKEEAGHQEADYGTREVEAARRVMTELAQILGAYRDAFVLVGGWVPDLLLPDATPPHIGSLDVDLLLNPDRLKSGKYSALLELLEQRGYCQTDKAFKYAKEVEMEGGPPVRVEVDFLIPEGAKTDKMESRPGFRAIDLEAGWMALKASEMHDYDGVTLEGGPNRVKLAVVQIEAFVVLKAFALDRRGKEKDAYDLVYSLKNWPGGSVAVAERIKPYLGDGIVKEALGILETKFRSAADYGPQCVARFLNSGDPDQRAFNAQDAFQRVRGLLDALGVRGSPAP